MRILFATDGSDGAATAGRLLLALPLPSDTHVTLLSAVPEHTWLDAPLLPEVVEMELTEARQVCSFAAAEFQERELDVDLRVCYAQPAKAILEQAESENADLIVVGSHGKGTIQRFLLGSVSERVARYARCSVLVARGDALRRVLVAADGSSSSEQSLEALARLPLPAEVAVQVTHVLQPRDPHLHRLLLSGAGADAALEELERELMSGGEWIVHEAQERLGHLQHVTTEIRSGSPTEELIAAAREWEADLLVVGAANRSPLGRLFLGSVSGRVLSHAPCSVLVARGE
jgi:nucleotide-binding universal stress UspA family protein